MQVNNLGLVDQPVNFFTTLNIYRDNTLVYTDRKSNTVKVNDSVEFVYKGFKPDVKGFYTMEAFTELENDQLKTNDTLYSKFTVGAPYDIRPIKFSMPEPDSLYRQSQVTLKPLITFSNFGFLNADTLFDVHFEAYSKGNRFYRNTKQITLNSDQSKEIAFDSAFIPSRAGEIKIYAIADLSKDNKHFNDTLIKSIYTFKEIDVVADSAFIPNGVDSVLVNTESFFPRFIIKNLGIDNLLDNWDIQCIIKDPNNQEVYNEMSTVSDLDSGSKKATIFSKIFSPSMEGYYNITFITMLESDQDPVNDTLQVRFYAVKKVDASAIRVVYPNDGQSILTDASAMIFPTIEIGQLANYPIKDSINAIVEIYSNGSRVYTDTIKTSLDSQEIRNFTFTKGFSRLHKGAYSLVAFTDHPLEQVNSNDSMNSTFTLDFAVSIKDLQAEKLNTYPNPVKKNGTIHIDFTGKLDGYVGSIYSVDGKLMAKDITLNGNKMDLPANLAAAIYFVVIQNESQLYRTTIKVID